MVQTTKLQIEDDDHSKDQPDIIKKVTSDVLDKDSSMLEFERKVRVVREHLLNK